MAKFTIAPAAARDLDEIWHYIAENSETAAEKFIRELARKFELLSDNKNQAKIIFKRRERRGRRE